MDGRIRIAEKENDIESRAVKAYQNGKKLYIHGCGEIGRILETRLRSLGCRIEAFTADRNYFVQGQMVQDIPVICTSDVLVQKEDAAVIIGHRRQKPCMDWGGAGIEVIDGDIFSMYSCDSSGQLDYEFVMQHLDKFQQTCDLLEDDKSRRCLEAYLNQKISGKFEYLKDCYEDNQYFDKELVAFSRIRTLADCGAYDGDSYHSFRKNFKENTSREYEGRAYLLETDPENYKRLKKNCENWKNCYALNTGAWDKKSVLKFAGGGTSGGISSNGSIFVNADSLDSLVEGELDFIKMDIEGSEYRALSGARQQIKTYHPILAVCVYHKKWDLIEIPQLILSFCPEYKFYLRAYSRYCQELVLYGIYGGR